MDSHRHLQSAGSTTSSSSKVSWKRQKHLEGGRSHHHLDKFNRPYGVAFGGASVGVVGSDGHGHGNSSLGQKRKLPPREQKKNDSWIKAKQKLSPTEFQQRIKTGSCINGGEQGHIFEACTKPKPS